ncbi:MAG: hypothetical protein N4A72_17765 [Bacteroidales bacterium]|jgi:hypothetical protein|nr:hypothetical protein [Bacteroidales bacterium]
MSERSYINDRDKREKERLMVPMAIYSNIATSSVEKIVNIDKKADNEDALLTFIKNHKTYKDEDKPEFIFKLQNNIYLFDWLIKNEILLKQSDNEEIIRTNFTHAVELLELLNYIRNIHAHTEHTTIKIEYFLNNKPHIKDAITTLYNIATYNAGVALPAIYSGQRAIFEFTRSNNGAEFITDRDGNKINGSFDNKFTLTGYIFYISLFLLKHEVSDFLNALEQSVYTFNKIKERQQFRDTNPKKQYPEELVNKRKHFLYARNVYTQFAIRGHIDTLFNSSEYITRERALSVMEYLKRCPAERLVTPFANSANKDWEIENRESSDIYLDPHKEVRLTGYNQQYPLREKNKFFEYAVQYLYEEMQTLGMYNKDENKWLWALHAPAAMLNEQKREYNNKRIPKHKKYIWDIPDNENYIINDRGENNGFPFFFERGKDGSYNHALFRLERGSGDKSKVVIGKLSADTLCTILENYLYRFPVKKNTQVKWKERKKFFNILFKNIFNQIEGKCNTGRGNGERVTITKKQIKNKIEILRNREAEKIKEIEDVDERNSRIRFGGHNHHVKATYIAKTWNKMIMYGQENNPAHAEDYNGITGGKSGYMEIVRLLTELGSRRDTAVTQPVLDELFRNLKGLGNKQRIGNNYYALINKQIRVSGIMGNSGSPEPIKKKKTLNDLYKQAKEYNQAILNRMEQRLDGEFNADEWHPNAEMRWLKLRDNRTPQAANYMERPPKDRDTGIYNVDKHFYSVVGVKYIDQIEVGRDSNCLSKTRLCSLHNRIYPGANNNTLLYKQFYNTNVWDNISRSDRQRLFNIKRQDTILSHIAYYYTIKIEDEYQNRTLSSLEFDKDNITIPVNRIFINTYYRYLKQNRYRMIPQQIKSIADIVTDNNLIESNTISFAPIVKKRKADLTNDERFSFLSVEEKKMRWYEANQLADKKLKDIKEDTVFIRITENPDRFYLADIITGYNICRMAFVDRLLRIERDTVKQFNLTSDKGYIDFKDVMLALQSNYNLSQYQAETLRNLRNCAMHNEVPTGNLLPDSNNLIKRVKDNNREETGDEYIDFFGRGTEIINEIYSKTESRTEKAKL